MEFLKSTDYFATGELFPPQAHFERVQRYKTNKKLYEGHHCEVFNGGSARAKDLLYVSLNLAGTICKKSADFLFGESIKILAGKGQNTEEQKALDRFYEENNLNILLYESALSNAYLGDSFIKIRYGQEYAGELPAELDEPRVIIENINPAYVFPQATAWDKSKIATYHIAMPVYDDKEKQWFLCVESHSAGKIEYCNYYINVLYTDADQQVGRFTIDGEVTGSRYIVNTGVPMPLVVHVPNMSLVDCWTGKDDLTEHHNILDEINNRLTQISDILDKHANPAIAVPAGLLQEDGETGEATFRVGYDKVFEVMGKDDVVPQYITWNSNLNEAFMELDKLVDLFLMTAEVPPVVLGKGTGTSGTGSFAIKWQMNSLLAKINRKKQYYSKGIKQAIYIAQKLEQALGIAKYEPFVPSLVFADGLPKDTTEETNIVAIRTGGAKTMSQKTAIMILNDMTEEQAEQEIERIKAEQEADMVTAEPTAFNTPFDTVSQEQQEPQEQQQEQEPQKLDNRFKQDKAGE